MGGRYFLSVDNFPLFGIDSLLVNSRANGMRVK